MDEERYDATTRDYIRREHEDLIDPAVADRRGLNVHRNGEGVITAADVPDNSNLSRLFRARILEGCHVDTGMFFTTMRMVALKKLDVAKLELDDGRGVDVKESHDPFMYARVCRTVDNKSLHRVERACFSALTDAMIGDMFEYRHHYRQSFERLQNVIDEVKKLFEDEKKWLREDVEPC